MGSPEESPLCSRQLLVRGEQEPEPTNICSCPAGLIHMDDCPVTLGMECVHFHPGREDAEILTTREHESIHQRLMEEFLSRAYHHRVRSLAPAGSDWHRRRDAIGARFEDSAPEARGDEALAEDELSAYERERERRLAQRRKREQDRREREAQERRDQEAQAVRRAEQALQAAEARAARTMRERPVLKPAGKEEEAKEAPARRRRRRRRRKPAAAQDQAPAARTPPSEEAPRRRRRRRRRPRKAGPGDKPA